MAKGDQVVVLLRGRDTPVVVETTIGGRKLALSNEKDLGISWITVEELTHTDRIMKSSRFAAADVIAVIDRRSNLVE